MNCSYKYYDTVSLQEMKEMYEIMTMGDKKHKKTLEYEKKLTDINYELNLRGVLT